MFGKLTAERPGRNATPASRTRFCSFCELEVLRTEVHKDTRGRYSCRSCRAQGRHLSRWQKMAALLDIVLFRGR